MQTGIRLIDIIRGIGILGSYQELKRLVNNNDEMSARRMSNLTGLLTST